MWKAWRLHIQKKYINRDGMVVKELDPTDDAVIRAWAGGGTFALVPNTGGSKDTAIEV